MTKSAEALAEEATAWFVRMTSDWVTDAERRAFPAPLARDSVHNEAYVQVEALCPLMSSTSHPGQPSCAPEIEAVGWKHPSVFLVMIDGVP